ncbi:MAG TPA: Uma2 family endonuclease [Symbiobacteriaceae bacterium]|nr:Uma2 family endonuclease [Symbiobacteriaceae bacterium]
MILTVPRVKITYEDYLQLPEEQRYEVLEGDLRMVPAPGSLHQLVVENLYFIARNCLGQRGRVCMAPRDVILDEDSVVQPDLFVILRERLGIIAPEGVRGAPDLVVEVLSPSIANRDRGVKRRLYARYGVPEYWIIDPQERLVEVACLCDGVLETVSLVPDGAVVRSPLLPELTFAVADLFVQ